MHRSRRILFVLVAAATLCAMFWQTAQTQSPLRRITNTTEDGINLNPAISGDGRIVGFESTEDVAHAGGADAFRAIRANVSLDPATFLQMGATRAPAPALSQDGSRIAFASKDNPLGSNNDANSEIFLYDGARLIQVTSTSPGDISNRITNGNFSPSISDDGRFIAFSSNRDLASQNSDGNLEVFVYDSAAQSFTQLTNTSGIVGSTDAKISGNGASIAYIRDNGATTSANRDLLLQNRVGTPSVRVLVANAQSLAMTFGRAISDDGQRVVWSALPVANGSQVYLFDGRNNNTTRQVTTLGTRVTDVPLYPTISGDGSKIAFATRRTVTGTGSNSDGGVELYTFDLPSGTIGRITNLTTSGASADVVSSLNDDGSVVAFNFPRLLSGPVSLDVFENNSEIYLTGTPARPTTGTITVFNRASFGHEPSTTKAVAPDSMAVAIGGALAFSSQQATRNPDGSFPTTVAGTSVTVNGQPAQIFFVSPTEVHFHVPATTVLGTADVVVTNSDGFQSRGSVTVLRAAPGIFTKTGDGLGEAMVLNADTLQPGPFDPTSGNLRLIIFSTGVRNGTTVSVTAGGRTLTLESIVHTPNMPGMDEVHVLVPSDLRGVGKVDLVIRADGRDSNPASVEFSGDARRDILINEFLADPPGSAAGDLAGDANRDGVRDSADDEFIELVNTTNHDIDISGYRLFTRGTGSDTVRHLFAAGTVLRPCSAVVVFGGGNASFNPNDPAFGGALVLQASTGGLSLVNSGGAITLQDQTGAIANLVSYGNSADNAGDNNQSVTRSPDITGNFAQHLAASGGVRAFSPGTQINGAAFSTCAPAVARVEVSPASATINANQTQQFTARAFDASNNEIPGVIFSWQSSNNSVATIDQNGLATGVSAGTAEIRATGRGVQSPPATLTVNAAAAPNVVINEVDSDQAGTDTQEFVELYDGGAGNTSLTGLVIVFYNGSDDSSYAAFDLDGKTTNASGYFTLGNAAVPGVDMTFTDGLMQNGADAVAIYVGNASAFPNGTPLTTTNLIDALVYDTNDADDAGLLTLLNSGQPQVNEDAGGNGTVNSNQRCPNGSGGPRNTSTYNQFVPTPDGANGCVATVPTLSINDVSANEGNSGTTTFNFTVSLSAPAPAGGVTFDISTADNTATIADNDYVSRSLTTQTIAAGNQTYQFAVTVNGDAVIEPNETFFVNVSNVAGATISDGQGVGTIQNDDSPTLSINDVTANEGNSGTTTFTFTVTSSLPAPAGGITFDIATADGTAQDDNPTTEDNDYVTRSLSAQTITAGNTTYTFDVTVNGDTTVEGNETFFVNLSNATGASILDGQGQGTIQNDDGALLVISQAYAGGGNTGAQYTNDFVEIFNHGSTTVNFATTPFSVQYAGATSSFSSSKVDLTTGSIAPGQYFLVQLGGGANGVPLPTPDATGTIAMAATAGKVALVSGTTALTGSGCPLGATIVDFVGYGTTADCFEGSGRAPAPSNTTADFRKAGGCTDTNDNAADFLVSAPFPRNTSSPLNNCTPGAPPNLTINDVSVVETNSGTTTATFTVSLSAPAPSTDITFDIATADGTAQDHNPATEDNDYVARSLTNQIIPAGQSTYTFTVTVNGDVAVEPNETFFVNVTNASGATITDGQGQGTIQNDDLPSLTINDVSQNEGNTGTSTFMFAVSLSAPAPAGGVTFDIATQDNTATLADNDYVQHTLTSQTIPAGSSNYNFDVTVNGDAVIEPNETFFVNVTSVSGAAVGNGQGQGTILNDDSPALSVSDVSQAETNAGTTTFTFTVTSTLPAPAGGITFDVATADGTAQDDNPPSEDNDYVARSLTGQTITAGNTSYTFDVTVNGDTFIEPNETFFVNISNAVNAAITDSQGQGTIQNDDIANLVISQVYGGGGNAGAQYTNDFVELFNRGTATVNFAITPFSVQYAGATATFGSSKVDLTSGSMAPGQYFLIQLSSGGASGGPLPTPDANGTIAMAAGAGKVALVSGTTALGGSGCPLGATVVDFVGYGTTADCFEGSGRAGAPGNSTTDLRKDGGCTDTNDNAADFLVSAPFPRNTSSPFNNCSPGVPPNMTINDVSIVEGNSGTSIATFTVSLSAPAPSTDVTFDISTADGTAQDHTPATEDNDYIAHSLTNQVIPAGQQTYTFTVTVNGDVVIENDETFFVNLANVSGATLTDGTGQGTIRNDDLPALTVTDVTLPEGNSGTKLFTFSVNLSAPAPTGGVTFDIATQDNTATLADNDYVQHTLASQTIPAGSSSYNFDVTVNGDLVIEPNETFFVNVSNVVGATASDSQGLGTIQNDDSPALSVSDVTANETNSGTTIFSFTVTSSLPAPAGGITFDIATADGTAQDGTPGGEDNDYVARSLTSQTITAGNSTYTFDVTVNGDSLVEPNETFFVNLANVVNASVNDGQGQGNIQNDDAALLVISQIYGGGNNAGATFQNDFVELFNRGTATVNFAVTPYSVQYASAAGTFSSGNTINLTTGSLLPGQYFLISLAGGTTNGAPLPTADATNTAINMAATDGKVALVAGTTVLTGSGCPIGATVADFIGYGSANCSETTATAVLSATKSARRTSSCVDSDNNSADFTVVTNPAAPRNSASPISSCGGTPTLTINDVSVTEGNSGTVVASFTVSLSFPAPAGGVTFDIATQNNSATTADNDYLLNSLTSQTITAGNSTYNFAVTVNGDVNVEPDETFFVNVTNVSGATLGDGQGLGTIQNDDSAPLPNLTVNDVTLAEGNSSTTTFAFTVSLSAPAPAGGVTFDIATADGTAQDDNPATEDNDYVAQSLTSQTITAGNTTYTFNVTVNGDVVVEPNETFFVNVTNVTNANLTDNQGQGTITNDDSAATPGAIVISQVYGGGGNTGAPFLNDFIELFNRGGTAVDVTGWSVQYIAATGAGSFTVTPICPSGPCLIQPGQYFLIKESSGGANGAAFTADVTGTIVMATGAGRVAVVNNITALSGATACGTQVSGAIDYVGYGATASCFEGAGPTPAPSNTTSVLRAANGCTDTNVNSADFAAGAPNPRNTSTPTSQCPGTIAPPETSLMFEHKWREKPEDFSQRLFANYPESRKLSEIWACTHSGTLPVVCSLIRPAKN
ncbi:MAG TPA: Calx-beta domain-containing protein [Pyrinomonadaceae bacterium]|nr:Calx-beta domain-containing protein [Pyrinomonadaceae bacterium]